MLSAFVSEQNKGKKAEMANIKMPLLIGCAKNELLTRT